jgi:predicted nuclease of predicted toxin-antitoxin system
VKFLVDQQLPPALTRWLLDEGHAAEHVGWLKLERATDDVIWREAARTGAAIVSKDEDFARRRMLASDGPPVVWVRIGDARTASLLQAFAGVMPSVLAALTSGEALVEMM